MWNEDTLADILREHRSMPPEFPYGRRLDSAEAARIRNCPELQPWLAQTRTVAERARTEEIPVLTFSRLAEFERTGGRKAFEVVNHERRLRLQALTVVSVIDETDLYIETIEDLLWETCNEYTWCLNAAWPIWRKPDNIPDVPLTRYIELGAAMTAHRLAEAVYVLRGRLHPLVEQRVREEVLNRVVRAWIEAPKPYPWERMRMNWAAVCAGGSGMAGLLLADEEEARALLPRLIPRAVRAMESYLQGFGADGGCAEGLGYWQYGMSYFAAFAEMLRVYTAGEVDLFTDARLTAIAEFPIKCELAEDRFVNYSDSSQRSFLNPGLFGLLRRRLGMRLPLLKPFERASMAPSNLASVLWYDADTIGGSLRQGTFVLEALQWVVDRRVRAGNWLAFSAKGGHNDEPHNHNDLGHFLLHVAGDNLLVDLGSPVYTKDYFTERRYANCHASSLGHSVPVIGGELQAAGAQHRAELLALKEREDGVEVTLDLTRAYALPSLRRFTRAFAWTVDERNDRAELELRDDFRLSEEGVGLQEAFVSLTEPELSAGRAVWTGRAGRLVLRYPSERLRAEVQQVPIHPPEGPGTMYRLLLTLSECRFEETIALRFAAETAAKRSAAPRLG
ncbi:heparinase II/III family protein [Paenibacillus sp. IB182496]|uniref:Heparinase II/III family protein n=1 Tax=Paenibacillus sabuli TaxID=2772509 RepID=A0A927BRR3_9BACL|nr:heparinase II/III family protein [Paenibacillus sabuli]MBD2845563.1 heparinase II/III family protein [Paenibacillus sabuli]